MYGYMYLDTFEHSVDPKARLHFRHTLLCLGACAVDFWCIHPGGRRIIEEAMNGLGLTEEQASDSWAVLGEYGNMLSPSVMFVLTR